MKKKKFKQIQNQAQEGRSMVEMLGVLAIIGVLSVGSLSGYEYATASYRAGQIRDALLTAKKSASVNTSASYANEIGRLLKGYLPLYGVSVDAMSSGQHPYQVQLKGVAPRTCTHLWEMKNVLSSFSIEMTSPESKNGCQLDNASVDTVSMSFAFNALDNKTESGSSSPSSGCTGNADCGAGYCQAGVCVDCRTSADCSADQVCDEQAGRCTDDCSKGVCQTGHCINHRCGECAEPTPKWNGKNCVACPPSAPKWTGSDCVSCPSTAPKWTGEDCVPCPDNTTWDGVDCVSVSCEYPTPVQQGTTCVSCAQADANKPMWNAEEHKCEACPEGTIPENDECVKVCAVDKDCYEQFEAQDKFKPAIEQRYHCENQRCTHCPAHTAFGFGVDSQENGACIQYVCRENSDCSGETNFCYVGSNGLIYAEEYFDPKNAEAFQKYPSEYIANPFSGRCINPRERNGVDVVIPVGTHEYDVYKSDMSYYDAERWCHAIGGEPAGLSDFGCKSGCGAGSYCVSATSDLSCDTDPLGYCSKSDQVEECFNKNMPSFWLATRSYNLPAISFWVKVNNRTEQLAIGRDIPSIDDTTGYAAFPVCKMNKKY